jgi:hypothetical protein
LGINIFQPLEELILIYCEVQGGALTLSPTAPRSPLYLTALGLICPKKNRADLPEGRELRATEIAAHSLRVSLLNNFFSNLILWNTISILNLNVITMEQLRNN